MLMNGVGTLRISEGVSRMGDATGTILEQDDKRKKRSGGKRVTAKQALRACYKWVKLLNCEIEEIKERLTRLEERISEMSVIMACGFAEGEERLKLIEWFLGGREAMKKVKEENERSEHKKAKHS